MDGFLNILKPPGMSSGDMVFQARRLLPRGTRVGHGGTLDPDAAGVLPVCVGRAARLFDYIIDKQKTYIAELRLGVVTDTQDASGTVLERRDASTVTEADVRAALPRFTGTISQIPPMYSALKRGGQKLCDLARRGESLELEPRPVTIHAIEYIGRRDETAHLLRVTCGKGTYIRTLCHDIGAALGVGGHMAFLLRSAAGCFDVQSASTLEELKAFHEQLLENYMTEMQSERNTLFKMKEYWNWLSQSFEGSDRYMKEIRKADTIVRYRAAVRNLLANCPLKGEV